MKKNINENAIISYSSKKLDSQHSTKDKCNLVSSESIESKKEIISKEHHKINKYENISKNIIDDNEL